MRESVKSIFGGEVGPQGLVDPKTGAFKLGLSKKDMAKLCETTLVVKAREDVKDPRTLEKILRERITEKNGLALHLLHLQKYPFLSKHTFARIPQLAENVVQVNIFLEKDLPKLMKHKPPAGDALLLDADKTDGHSLSAGVYLVSKEHLLRRARSLKERLTDMWEEVVARDWLEANLLSRMKCAGTMYPAGFPSLKKTFGGGYLYFPKELTHRVNSLLEESGGRQCLAKLAKRIYELYRMPLNHFGCLLEISTKRNRDPLNVDSQTPWVFYSNKHSTLSKKDLEFNLANVNNTLFRRFEDFVSENGFKTLSNVEFAKESYIAFPYACALRCRRNPLEMCRKRFKCMRSKGLHVSSEHNISPQEFVLVKEMDSYWAACGTVKNEFVYLEEMRLLNVFDANRLRLTENLRSLVKEFIGIQVRNMSIIEEMDNLLLNYKSSPLSSASCSHAELVDLCQSHVNYLKSLLLKHDDLTQHMTAWMTAINMQSTQLAGMNDMKQRITDRVSQGESSLEPMMSEFDREMARAGNVNLGAIRPDAVLQHLDRDDPNSSGLFGLALVSSMVTPAPGQAEKQVNCYRKKVYSKRKNDDEGPAAALVKKVKNKKSSMISENLVMLEPVELRVNLADFREHITIALASITAVKECRLPDLANLMTRLLHSMFIFTEEGWKIVHQVVLEGLLEASRVQQLYGADVRRGLWMVFCRVHQCLNVRIQQLAFLFRIRLTRLGDCSRRPVECLTEGYPAEVVKKASEITAMARGLGASDKLSVTWNHLDKMTCSTSLEATEELVEEVNSFRSTACCICQEPYSNRPLECFDCAAKELQSTLPKNMPEEELLRVLSSRIEATPKSSSIEQIGGHIFHKGCIRRWIQMQAVNPLAQAILCPQCRAEIYNRDQKLKILYNIHAAATKIGKGMSEAHASLISDDVINLKSEAVMGDLSDIMEKKSCHPDGGAAAPAEEVDPKFLQNYIKLNTVDLSSTPKPEEVFTMYDENKKLDEAEYVMRTVQTLREQPVR